MTSEYGGLEVMFSTPMIIGAITTVKTDIKAVPDYYPKSVYTPADVWISSGATYIEGSIFIASKVHINGGVIDSSNFDLETSSINTLHYRIVFSNSTVVIECNGLNVYTYTFSKVEWPDVATAKITANSPTDYERVTVTELRDPREAVFIDYEQNVASAIESIIQQRPVQQFAEVGREISFTYSATRDIVPAHHINSYSETTRDNAQISSDGLVYYTDVAISISEDTAKQIGLITKLYRLSELNNGALSATARVQKLALEKRKSITITCRLDPRLQIADRLIIDEILSGTETHLTDDVIIEDISLNIQNGNYSMSITARRKF